MKSSSSSVSLCVCDRNICCRLNWTWDLIKYWYSLWSRWQTTVFKNLFFEQSIRAHEPSVSRGDVLTRPLDRLTERRERAHEPLACRQLLYKYERSRWSPKTRRDETSAAAADDVCQRVERFASGRRNLWDRTLYTWRCRLELWKELLPPRWQPPLPAETAPPRKPGARPRAERYLWLSSHLSSLLFTPNDKLTDEWPVVFCL